MKTTLISSAVIVSLLLFSFNWGNKASYKTAKKALEKFCNYVPSGNSVINEDTTSVAAFYMSSEEITNFQYAEFLSDLKKNGETEKLKIASIDTAGWNRDSGNNATYSKYYHNHPAYHNYPVVNVSKQGAELFCQWLSDKYLELSNGEMKLIFRLPNRAEWLRAARGDNHYKVYSWGGPFITNSEGMVLANCIRNGAESIARNPETGKFEVVLSHHYSRNVSAFETDVTAPAKSYWPNEFGMYNMNGNVAEMIADGNFAVGGGWYSPGYDIRNESMVPFDGTSPTVGFRVVATYFGVGQLK